MVKPSDEGSTHGITIVKDDLELDHFIEPDLYNENKRVFLNYTKYYNELIIDLNKKLLGM